MNEITSLIKEATDGCLILLCHVRRWLVDTTRQEISPCEEELYYYYLLLSRTKERNWVICRDVDGSRDCHTE